MGLLIGAMLLTVACAFLMGCFLDIKPTCALFFFLCVMFFIGSLLLAQNIIRNGLPVTEIDPGDYKVAFVYVAGENVNLGLELAKGTGPERIYLYQFSRMAFGGEINANAKRLCVIQTGSFKRLELVASK